MTVVAVRPATAADRPGILALAPRLTEGAAPWRDPAAVLAAAEQWLAGSLDAAASGGSAVYVAAGPDGVLGVVSITEQRHFTGAVDAYVGELAVACEAEGQGIGRRLMAAAESWARERGLRRIRLTTGAANAPARGFYAALGFADEEVTLSRELG
ncbi:GNAT family N-acetyltransferase [Streptomyces sp. A7024]|uniref:GNAT family N-acetyltransferase n=1 Tax=Streptomyces coryli TaxID=1128680 RepID=A0A6G4U3Z7_9ACTN|nr:GNAT family N-acetyltransferase [Streptomyces coryli]NGN66732.1 GNAT family N-acetyltransferase [Streptomyces coryli]